MIVASAVFIIHSPSDAFFSPVPHADAHAKTASLPCHAHSILHPALLASSRFPLAPQGSTAGRIRRAPCIPGVFRSRPGPGPVASRWAPPQCSPFDVVSVPSCSPSPFVFEEAIEQFLGAGILRDHRLEVLDELTAHFLLELLQMEP